MTPIDVYLVSIMGGLMIGFLAQVVDLFGTDYCAPTRVEMDSYSHDDVEARANAYRKEAK